MSHPIPKIQYKNTDTIGDTTSGSGTITNVGDTSKLQTGMFVRGAGVPDGALVDSFDSNSVTLADGVQASATNSGEDLAFGFEIAFDYPPIEENGATIATSATTTESLSGIRQVAVNYVGETRAPIFSFVSQTLANAVNLFLTSWACLGQQFRYYDDKSIDSFILVELDTLKVVPKRGAPQGPNAYSWQFPLTFRRVL
jgi:hypothetical protein